MYFSPLNSKKKHTFLKNPIIKDVEDNEGFKTLQWEVNSEIIRYIFKKVMINLFIQIPDETTLQEAADIILEIKEYVEQVRKNSVSNVYIRIYLIELFSFKRLNVINILFLSVPFSY